MVTPLLAAFLLLTANGANGANDALAPAPEVTAPVVTGDDRAAAATTAGIGAFVGVALGGVVVPGAAGLIGGVVNARPSTDDQLLLTTVGGAGGALVGGALGAIPTTTPFLGEAAVGAAGAAGALLGLLPALYFAQVAPASASDPNDPVKLARSACLLVAVAGASFGAAGAGALLAAPKPPPQVQQAP